MTPEFEQLSFEDPTSLARCIKSDCQNYRAGNTPLCAQHLREQEVSAGASSIVEPEVEARARAAGDAAMGETYVGHDPDVNGTPVLSIPDPTDLEPHWDGEKWILQAKHAPASLACPHCGERITVKLS